MKTHTLNRIKSVHCHITQNCKYTTPKLNNQQFCMIRLIHLFFLLVIFQTVVIHFELF